MNTLPATRAVMLAVAALCTACDFVDAVSEISVGEGRIPRIAAAIPFPRPDEVVPESLAAGALPGLPADYSGATLAHLIGLQRLAGECSTVRSEPGDGQPIVELRAGLARCDGVDLCDALCREGFTGAFIQLETTVSLLSAEEADSLRGQLSELSEDAIVQVRLRIFELELATRLGGEIVSLNDRMADFRMWVETPTAGGTPMVERRHLASIAPDTPQRFEFPAGAPITAELKARVLAADPFAVTLVFQMHFPEWALYQVIPARTTLAFDIQPEFVISVLEAVEDR